eukprot:Gb_03510 [translate_table: standard]
MRIDSFLDIILSAVNSCRANCTACFLEGSSPLDGLLKFPSEEWYTKLLSIVVGVAKTMIHRGAQSLWSIQCQSHYKPDISRFQLGWMVEYCCIVYVALAGRLVKSVLLRSSAQFNPGKHTSRLADTFVFT